MYRLNNTFFWQAEICLIHELIIDEDFIKSNNISEIAARELILIFEHYYGIDIGDYGLRDIIIDQRSPNLTIHIKTIDQFRELQLRKLII
jgi:cytidylate kinase